MGAALTYARRYALFALVGIAGEDDLDAPDLSAEPPPEIPVPASPEENPRTERKTRNGTIHKPRHPKPVLATGPSVILRDQLIAELQSLNGGDDLALWAYRRLPAKNSLTADDARAVETAYQAVLDGSNARRPEVPASASDRHAEDCPVAPAHDVAHATTGQSIPQTKVASTSLTDQASSPNKKQRSPELVRVLSKTIRLRDPEHRKFVARQPCLVCGRTPVDAHHLRFAQPRALSRKVSDEFTVPLCRLHHRELHRIGDERIWWNTLKIDPLPVALKLWRRARPGAAGEKEREAIDAKADRSKPRMAKVGPEGSNAHDGESTSG